MPSFTINVNGENYTVGYDGTFDSPQGLIPALNNLGYGIFWIEQIGGVNVLTTVDDDDVWGTAETNSDPTTTTTSTTSTTTTTFIPIPSTTSTTTTTTLAPSTTTTSTTTTSTTLAPTTSTTTTTTLAPTTSTTTTSTTIAGSTTTSTTTTTTTLFAQTVNYASNASNACLNPTGTQNVVGNAVNFCDCTIFTSNGFATLLDGNYVLAYSGNTLDINISGFPTITATVTGGGCSACPLSTSTTTTSTTLQQVWYQLANCDGGGTVYTTNYDIGYADVTDRVFGNVLGVPSTLTVTSVLFSDPAGTQIGIVNSGFTGCPASTTTTTTTTTLPPVTLDLTATCTGLTQTITIDNFAGGDGTTYYANDTTYDNPALAAGGATSIIVGGTRTYTTQPNGTRYIYVFSSTRNTVKQGGQVDCVSTTTTTTTTTQPITSTTTTTTTQPPVDANISSVCTGITQTITLDTFTGGDGTTYFANDTTYGDPVSAAAGATSIIVGGTRTYTTQPNGTRYVYITSGTRNDMKQGGQTCTTTTSTTTTTTTSVNANIFVINSSLDVEISQVDFNGVTATYISGQPLPNTTGNGTNLNTTQIGTYTLNVYRNNATAGQHITVTDSQGTQQCVFFSSGSATESFLGVVYDGITSISIDVADGACTPPPPTNNYEYIATGCTGGTSNIIVDSLLSVGSVYYTVGVAPTSCYTIDAFVGGTNTPVNIVFGGIAAGCEDTINCAQL